MDTIDVDVTCPFCQKQSTLTVSAEGYNKWGTGTLIQEAFPELGPSEREGLMTGICGPCWDKMWAEDDDEPETLDLTDLVERGAAGRAKRFVESGFDTRVLTEGMIDSGAADLARDIARGK